MQRRWDNSELPGTRANAWPDDRRGHNAPQLTGSGMNTVLSALFSRFPVVDVAAANAAADTSPAAIAESLERCLITAIGKDPAAACGRDWLFAAALLARETLTPRWVASRRLQSTWQSKRVYYLSMEFLLGRLLSDTLRNLGLYDSYKEAFSRLGFELEDIAAEEVDPALGNGGLGRLAACLMDSLATVGISAYGYGLRFEYGLFRQAIEGGAQVEKPEHWLRHGSPWEFPRTDIVHHVPFGGSATAPREYVLAVAHDIPVCGYSLSCINTLRLWSARAHREFDTSQFNAGDHLRAVEPRTVSENLTRMLYPSDSNQSGRELRFKQEYFFVSASVQDILGQYCAAHASLDALPDKVAIAINDTHPAFVVPELMRLLVDGHGLSWSKAWDLTRRTVSYTNHTLMPEALETWPVSLFEKTLPRQLEIIYRINSEFLDDVRRRRPHDGGIVQRLSMVDERGERRVRMAHVAFAGSHRVNGVSKVHTELMKSTVFADFERLYPGRIVNVTNGVTPRRWLANANPALAALVTSRIGPDWLRSLETLDRVAQFADDPQFRQEFRQIKLANKRRLADHALARMGVAVDPTTLLDVHVKRIHEYKRQLLKLLHAITLYHRLRRGAAGDAVRRTIVFAGKAAPGYAMAKLIIKLIHDVADKINSDPVVGDRLKLLFIPNYSVSQAEIIIPAADVSEQISTAGTEASGTGNMKLALNGALTVGTLDGANIEIAEAVGREHFFAFGLDVAGAIKLRSEGYDPRAIYEADQDLREAVDSIAGGHFSPEDRGLFRPVADKLLNEDQYLVLADFRDYLACQSKVDALFRDEEAWTRWSILNVARLGRLSSDRAVQEYADHIWHAGPGADAAPLPDGTIRPQV